MAGGDDVDYEVERFLDKRVDGLFVEYLVRWKGFDSDWDSWEPVENLGNCTGKIAKFEKKSRTKLPDQAVCLDKKGYKKSNMAKKDPVKVLAGKLKKKSMRQVTGTGKSAGGTGKSVGQVRRQAKKKVKSKEQKTVKIRSINNVSDAVMNTSLKGNVKPQKDFSAKATKGKKVKADMKAAKRTKKQNEGPDERSEKEKQNMESVEKTPKVKGKNHELTVKKKNIIEKLSVKGDNSFISMKLKNIKKQGKTPRNDKALSVVKIKDVAKVVRKVKKADKKPVAGAPSKDLTVTPVASIGIANTDAAKSTTGIGKGKAAPKQSSEKRAKGLKRKISVTKDKEPGKVKKLKSDVKKKLVTNDTVKKTVTKNNTCIVKALSVPNTVSKPPEVSSAAVNKLPSPKSKTDKRLISDRKTDTTSTKLLISPSPKTEKVSKVNSSKRKKEQLKLSVANLIGLKKIEQNKDNSVKSIKDDSTKGKKKLVKSLSEPIQGKKTLDKSQKKAKTSSKVKKHKSVKVSPETLSVDDTDSDSDDDILYSLSDMEQSPQSNNDSIADQNGKSKTKPGNAGSKSGIAEKRNKMMKAVSSPELVSKTSKPKAKKIRLLDSLKQSSPNKPVRPVSPTLFYHAVKHSGPITTGLPAAFQSAQSHLSWAVPQEGNVLPSSDTQASLPISPASMSYKVLLENLPHQFHPKKNKKNGGEQDEDFERRISVRASECAFKYKEILIKKCNRYTQIWLNTHTQMKNALNPQVIQEITSALNAAKYDDSNLVMFSGLGNVFCSGVDLHYLTAGDKKMAAGKMVDALRDLVRKFITFPKLLVAVVTGPAIGLGSTLLPLCDIVYASDKASFYMPYGDLSQTPEGCASYTLPDCVGVAMANELLIGGRKITAIEACQLGLVSQVYWPTSMMQEVIPRVQHMALLSGKVLETTKLLMRSHQRTKLEHANESECNLLLERWPSPESQRAMEIFISNEKNYTL